MSSYYLPQYDTKLFSDVYSEAADFIADYQSIGLPTTISTQSATTLFYLLYANYGNNPIANYDETQFKYRLFSTIWQFGPTWEKRLEVQEGLRSLTMDELKAGSKAIYNHAFNPSTAPTTGSLEELTYVNDQNTTNYKRGALEAYATLLELLKTDVTKEFLDKFKKLFKAFVTPELTWAYASEDEEEEEEE